MSRFMQRLTGAVAICVIFFLVVVVGVRSSGAETMWQGAGWYLYAVDVILEDPEAERLAGPFPLLKTCEEAQRTYPPSADELLMCSYEYEQDKHSKNNLE